MTDVRVLNVVGGVAAQTGGPAVALVESTPWLAREGIRRTIFATDNRGPAGAVYERVSPEDLALGGVSLDIRTFPLSRPRRILRSRGLRDALRTHAHEFDVIHINGLYLYPHFAAWRAARRAGTPHIVSLHGALDPFLRGKSRARKAVTDALWQRRLLEQAAAIHVATDEEARMSLDVAPDVPRIVVPNGIDTGRFASATGGERFRAERLGGHTGPVILFMGRVSFKKGVDLLIRALPRVRERHDAVLAVVGPDDEGLRPRLRALAGELGVGRQVVFIGPLYGEDRLPALAAADAWALASHGENFGIAIVEALAARVPVVVSSKVMIARDLDRAGAAIVTELEPDVIAARLGTALTDEPLRAGLVRAGSDWASGYDWSQVGRRFAALYREVLTLGSRRR